MRRLHRVLLTFMLFIFIPIAAYGEVKEYVLNNGLKVLILEDHKAPLAIFQVWYRIGSKDEPSGKTGVSHLLEHMMFKGTPKFGSKVFSKIVQRNGGVDNAHTTKDYTMYFQILSSDRIGLSVELESDRMTNLVLDPKEAVAERSVVMEERRMRYEDDPQGSLYEALMATAFMSHPYRRPVIGWMSDLSGLEREDLMNHYKKYYSSDNAFIVVVGDVKAEEMIEKIRASFGQVRGSSPQKVPATREPEQRGEKRLSLKKEAELPYVAVAYHTPSFPHEDSYGLEVLGAILSGGKSSRIYQTLVYERNLALNAGADYSGMNLDPFLFFAWGTASPGREIRDVEEALYGEIEKIKERPPTDKEIQKAKNQIEASFIFDQDSLYMQARKIGTFELLGGWRFMDSYLEGIKKVTAEDVQRVARTYLTEENRTVATLIPVPKKDRQP